MATATMNRPWLTQSDWQPQIPDPKTLDPRKMTFIFDADMDELTILFYGKDRRHSVHPVTEIGSALIDSTTGEAVGIAYGQFFKTLVPKDPSLLMVLMAAEILPAGEGVDTVIADALPVQNPEPGIRERLVAAYRALRGIDLDSITNQKRKSLQRLPSLC